MKPYRSQAVVEPELENGVTKSMFNAIASVFVVIVGFLGVIIIAAIFSILSAIPVYFLWNWIGPEVFHLPELRFAQAWGLSWLCSLLFKGSCSSPKEEKK